MATKKQLRALAHARNVKRMRRRRGGGLFDTIKSGLKKAHRFVKDKKILSTGADLLGYSNAGNFLRSQGYGKKRRRRGRGMRTKLDLGLLPRS